MLLSELITPEAVVPFLKVNTKKHVLQELSDRAGLISGLAPREIFDVLLQRERLGSTGIGEGIAIPHGKLAKAKTIFGIFARLARPVVNSKVMLKVTPAVNPINAGAVVADAAAQRAPDGAPQCAHLGRVERVAAA